MESLKLKSVYAAISKLQKALVEIINVHVGVAGRNLLGYGEHSTYCIVIRHQSLLDIKQKSK